MKAGVGFDRVLHILMVSACAIIMAMTLFINFAVVMRYAFHRPILSSVEVSEFSLVFITALGLAWLLKEEGHVKVDIVLARLKPRPQALVDAITSALCVVFLLIFCWYSLQDTLYQFQFDTREYGVLRFPTVFLQFPLLIGFLLFSIQFMRRSYSSLKSWRAGGYR